MRESKKDGQAFSLEKVLYWPIVLILLVVAGLTATTNFRIPGDYWFLAVRSGSMKPLVRKGSLIVVRPAHRYQEGEIIAFVNPNLSRETVTHRIFKIKENNDRISFVTKGDANEAPDTKEVFPEMVSGKLVLTIPYLGYSVSFAKTLTGLILLIILPAVVIIYGEIRNIKAELILIRRRQKKGD